MESGTRAERKRARREEILRVAEDLVREGGLAALTTVELAARTGSALGALYRVFPSKQAVIAALQVDALGRLRNELDAAREAAITRALDEGSGPRVRALAGIVASADAFFALPAHDPVCFRCIDELLSAPAPALPDDDARAIEAALAPVLGRIGALVDVLAREGPDALRFPYALWAALHGASHFTKRDRLVDPLLHARAVAGTLVVLLLRGLGAAERELDDAWAFARPRALAHRS